MEMPGKPTCRDCGQEMIAAKGFHAILAFQPPDDIAFERFSPVSLYVCAKCGQIRLYRACRKQSESEKMEVVSYGYRVTAQKELR
jgi:predicted RNA-binding Zn-ribbon protein involved in translation (DUF1610 family)